MTVFEKIKQNNEEFLSACITELFIAFASGVTELSVAELQEEANAINKEVLVLLKSEVGQNEK